MGRSKGGLTTKIHVAALSPSRVAAVALSPGQRGDLPLVPELWEQAEQKGRIRSFTADRAYDSNAMRDDLALAGVKCVIPPKCCRRIKPAFSKMLYRRRHKVENWFRRIQDFRRVATRYDKLACMFMAFVHVTAAVIAVRDLVNTP